MDNAQKAIMIGVGLFITIIIISVVLLITTTGKNIADEGTSQITTMTSQLQNQIRSSYDNKTVTGAQVLSLYNEHEGDANFIFVFDLDRNNDNAHASDNTELYYNDNGFANPFAGINRTAGEMFVNYNRELLPAGGKMPTKISTLLAANTIRSLIDTTDTYQTYLIMDGDSVVGVYARLRATTGLGVRGMDTTVTATTL